MEPMKEKGAMRLSSPTALFALMCSIVGVVAACWATVAFGGGAGVHSTAGGPSGVQFPLWRLLPSKAFATLGRGRGPETMWAVYTFRPDGGAKGALGPCVAIESVTVEGSFPSDAFCGPIRPSQNASGAPRYALISRGYGGGGGQKIAGEAVFAVAVGADIKRVSVQFEDSESGDEIVREGPTKILSASAARKAKVVPFRFVVLGLSRSVCVASISGLGASGDTLFDSPEGECPLGTS